MRPTRLGVFAAGMAAFTLFAAGSTGNNLLYLLFAATVAGLVLSAVFGALNLRGLRAHAEPPEQAFRAAPFTLRVVVENPRSRPARLVRVVGPSGAGAPAEVPPGGAIRVETRLALPTRGLNRVEGLLLETTYPFGFFSVRRRIPPVEMLVLPQAGPFHPQQALEADPRAAGEGARGKAREGDFFGPRAYSSDDDARLIHWKLTAKTGSAVVLEYATAPDGRAVVRLDGADDASVERAAAACRWFIDAGAETGLAGAGVEVAPARGLAQLDKLLRALALAGEGGKARPAAAGGKIVDDGAADTPALRRLTLFGGAIVYLSMFLIEDLNPRALLAFGPLLPLGVWLQERGGPFPPSALWNACSVVMLVFLVAVDFRWSGVALANAHLLGYLLINRLFNPWPRRELRQALLILYLAFFLVSGLTISPWYFPLFVAWTLFCAAWLSLQSGARPEAAREWFPALGRILVAGVALGAAVFLVVPRVEGLRRFNPFVASGMDKLQIRSQAVMGFTDRVSLGHFGTLRRSSARAMRVRVEHPPAPGAAPTPLYVRGAAFDDFDGATWSKKPLDFRYRSAAGKAMGTVMGRAMGRAQGAAIFFPAAEGPGTFFDFEVYPMQVSVVFTVGAPRSVDGIAGAVWFDHTDSLLASGTFGSGGRYRVIAGPAGSGPSDFAVDLRERALERALRVPPDPGGRVAALAAQWTKGLADPRAKANEIARRLTREYGYSTHSDGRKTSLPDFLFDTRRGNCEYFATAAAILLRHAGVPTRLVTGFRADDWNEWGRFFDVRQSQAHAWTEAYIPGSGWVGFDATPGESGLSAAADEFSRRLERWANELQARWYRSVIGYDQYSQRDAFLRFRVGLALESVRTALERVLKRALPPLLGLGLLWWLWGAVAAFRRPQDEFERAERALARAGVVRRPSQTPREFAREAAAARPELAPLVELAEAHYRRRYAGLVPDDAARRRAAALLAELKSKL